MTIQSVTKWALACMAMNFLSGCAETPEETNASEEYGEQTSDLLGGALTGSVPEVVLIFNKNGSNCSGTLVTSTVVLTAAHCALRSPQMVRTYDAKGNVTAAASVRTAYYNKQFLADNPNFDPNKINSIYYVHDVGLLKLATPIPSSVAKPRGMTNDTNPPNGTGMTVVGYGATDTAGHNALRRNYVYFQWPNKTKVGMPGDSGGPVIRRDTGDIVRVASAAGQNDAFAPLNASWSWIQSTMSVIAE
jgi:V8-like Glu-specific endopeptidase